MERLIEGDVAISRATVSAGLTREIRYTHRLSMENLKNTLVIPAYSYAPNNCCKQIIPEILSVKQECNVKSNTGRGSQ